MTATATENAAGVTVELEEGVDANKLVADVKNAVDRITSFPEDAERPVVNLLSNRRQVISMVIYGDQSEEVLRQIAERTREALLSNPEVTYVELSGVRNREISIEVSQEELRRYNLTLPQIAQAITLSAVELPAGGVKTTSGEILLRTAERRDFGEEFRDIPVVTQPDGTTVTIGGIATIVDGFEDTDLAATFNGKRAVMIDVYRSGEQTPIEVADAVFAFVEEAEGSLPPGVRIGTLNDRSEMYRERVDLLIRNARLGLILVLLILGLFLNIRLAFWVTMGIPISFLGSLLLLPTMDVSINMISLFAFIITLGVVVDDAIVVGENVFEQRRRGATRTQAAVVGTTQIAMPVVFSVLTTVAAFLPLFLVPGTSGKFFRVIPAIVVCVLAISLVESLFVLPAHLAHRGRLSKGLWRFFVEPFLPARLKSADSVQEPSYDEEQSVEDEEASKSRWLRWLERPQRAFSRGLQHFIRWRYAPVLSWAIRNRGLTAVIGAGILILTAGFLVSGRLNFTFMPRVDSDVITANAELPFGVPVEETQRIEAELLAAARAVLEEHGGERITRGVYTLVGNRVAGRGGPGPVQASAGGSHLTSVRVYLVPSDRREISAREFTRRWRERTGALAGLESLTFAFSTGPGAGAAMELQLMHTDVGILERAAGELAEHLASYQGVSDIDDGFSAGKPQLDFTMRAEGVSLGLTAAELGRQVRAAFFGAEALRQQRGRDEVRVMVRRPEAERGSEFDIEGLLVRTRDGGELPLSVAARVERNTSYTQIKRADGRRVVTVSADVVQGEANADKVLAALNGEFLPELVARHAGLAYSFEGQRRRSDESLDSLKANYVLAMIIVFALLAIPFKSYLQPLVVMSAIPFGLVGAVIGHVLMGYDLSLISILGFVAVSGIVVNDSLVLVHAANRYRDLGNLPVEAIQLAGARRLRPIVLTSLTTFFGLAPMIFEPSVQARFLIPMAISLGFGVLFATFVILLFVPATYMLVEDARALVLGARTMEGSHDAAPPTEPVTG